MGGYRQHLPVFDFVHLDHLCGGDIGGGVIAALTLVGASSASVSAPSLSRATGERVVLVGMAILQLPPLNTHRHILLDLIVQVIRGGDVARLSAMVMVVRMKWVMRMGTVVRSPPSSIIIANALQPHQQVACAITVPHRGVLFTSAASVLSLCLLLLPLFLGHLTRLCVV